MDTSYAELAQRLTVNQRPREVNDAIRLLQCHNSRGVICSQCENNDRKCFKVTAIDNSGYITEVKCKRCKKTSYVCRYQECCLRRLSASCLETSYKEKCRLSATEQIHAYVCYLRVHRHGTWETRRRRPFTFMHEPWTSSAPSHRRRPTWLHYQCPVSHLPDRRSLLAARSKLHCPAAATAKTPRSRHLSSIVLLYTWVMPPASSSQFLQ